jgi:hypothetical protein
MDLMGKYLIPRWLSVNFYGWLCHRALDDRARSAS